MRNCTNCAEENNNETLFCKHCGCCLLAPNPEASQPPTATLLEFQTALGGIEADDGHAGKRAKVFRPRRSSQPAPSVIQGWLLILNLLLFILMFEIVKYIVIE